MTKIDIYSGFLGAGKTTLIKKMIQEHYSGQKLVLIENEFGQIGIDGGFLQDSGINITEMNSGCICCSLVGDFGKALTQVISEYAPERIIIEPSGVGKLSDVIGAVNKVTNEDVTLGYTVAVVDAGKVKVYTKNFGEFYNNQVETATTIVLSRTDSISQQKLDQAVSLLREKNPNATIVTTPWDQLTGAQLAEAMEGNARVAADLEELEHAHRHHEEGLCCCGHDHEHEHHDHHHDHHHEDGHCCCGHDHEHEHHDHHHDHHHDDGHCCCGHDHEHEHHDHHHDHHHEDGHCSCGHDHVHEHHDHHHDHHHEDGHCSCGHDHDHEHHHHHADEVFTSWGVETTRKFTVAGIEAALSRLDTREYGFVLRAKGIVAGEDGSWIHFDYVPGERNIRTGSAAITGKLCVIGSDLDEQDIAELFGV